MKTIDQETTAGCVVGAPLLCLRIEGLAVFILSIFVYAHMGAPWWRFLALLLLPDVTMAGYWLGARLGAFAYNLGHSYVVPVALAVVAITTLERTWLPYLLIWTAHIGMDRAMGYGLKYPDGFKRTHLGLLGSAKRIRNEQPA